MEKRREERGEKYRNSEKSIGFSGEVAGRDREERRGEISVGISSIIIIIKLNKVGVIEHFH